MGIVPENGMLNPEIEYRFCDGRVVTAPENGTVTGSTCELAYATKQ